MMKKFLLPFLCFSSVVIVMTSCEDIAPSTTKSDVVRFDYKVDTDTIPNADSLFNVRFSNDTIWPYQTAELDQYQDNRDAIESYSIDNIDFRFYTFTEDDQDNVMTGMVTIISESGQRFDIVLSENGVDYKDAERHSIFSIESGEVTAGNELTALAEALVDGDYFIIESSELNVTHQFAASVSIYVDYTITAKAL